MLQPAANPDMLAFLRILLLMAFGGLFVWTGLMKALEPMAFLDSVRSFALLPDPYAPMLALFLPWLEIFAGFAVVTGFCRKGGLLLLNTALVFFLIAIGIAWYRGTDIRCGCFGASEEAASNYVELVVRDLGLLALGLLLAWWGRKHELKMAQAEDDSRA
jgi:putative oxidoreductase